MSVIEKPFLTVFEASEYFNLGVSTLRRDIAQGLIPVVRYGRKVFINKQQFTEQLQKLTNMEN